MHANLPTPAMTDIKLAKTTSRKRLAYGALVVILFVTFGAHAVVQLSRGHGTEDFGYFYHAARAMWNREDIYAATNGHYIYPPFLVFIFQPLAFVSAQTAAIIWIVISGLLMFAAALIASKEAATRWHPTDAAIDPSIPLGNRGHSHHSRRRQD